MNNLNKEEKEFLKLLSEEASTPNPAFKRNLRNKFVNTYSRKNMFISIFNQFNQYQMALMSLTFISIVSIGGLVLLSNKAPQPSTSEVSTALSKDEKQVILEKIIKNNNIGVLDNPINKTVESKTTTGVKVEDTPAIIKPDTKDFNYRYTQTTIKAGVAFNDCAAVSDYYKKVSLTETREYFSDNTNFYKFQAFDKSNNTVDTRLIKEDASKGEYTLYKDNVSNQTIYKADNIDQIMPSSYPTSYGVKLPISYPLITDKKEVELITSYLAQNPDIKSIKKENNREYYIMQGDFAVDCQKSNPTSYPASYPASYAKAQKSKISYEYWIDTQTYNIVKLQVYADGISPDNLIWSASTVTLKKSVDFKDVSKEFSLN